MFLLLCIESDSIGRCDKTSLSHQSMMELLIDGITTKKNICGILGDTSDISEWKQVKMNANYEVTVITWCNLQLHGTVNLQWIPPTTYLVYLNTNRLSGSLDLTALPNGLKELFLGKNHFLGTVDLTKLPEKMKILSMAKNQLTGTPVLTNLPRGLSALYLSDNLFDGTADFSRLPEKLGWFDFSDNEELCGAIQDIPTKTFVARGTHVVVHHK